MAPRARQAKGKARIDAYDQLVAESESAERRETKLQISIPPGPRLGDLVVEAEHLRKGYGDRLLVDDLSFSLPPRRDRRRDRRQRRGQDHALPHARRAGDSPTVARSSVGPTVEFAYVDQSRESLDADKTVWEEITGGVDLLKVGNREVHGARLRGRVQLQGLRPAEAGRRSLRRRAQPRASRQGAAHGRATCCSSTSPPTTSTSTRCARSKRRCSSSRLRGRDQPRSLVPRPHRHAHARVRGRQRGASGSRATTPTTRSTGTSASAPTPISPIASSTSRSRVDPPRAPESPTPTPRLSPCPTGSASAERV